MSDAQPILPKKIDRRSGQFFYKVEARDWLGLPWPRPEPMYLQTNLTMGAYADAFVDDVTFVDRRLQTGPKMQHGQLIVSLVEDPDIRVTRKW